jgi:hypothetical protein
MLRSLILALIAGLALVLIAATEASLLIPLETEVCRQNEQTHQKECATYNTASVVVSQVFDFLNYTSPAFTALATIAIAAFTWTLWRATSEHSRITDGVLALARDEFNATHRPKLRVRHFRLIDISDKQSLTKFTIVNVGTGTAKLFSSLGRTDFFPLNGQPTPNYLGGSAMIEVPKTLASGAAEEACILLNKRRPGFIGEMASQFKALHAFGHISYADVLDNVRMTAFCRRYIVGLERFDILSDPDYEYED